MYNADVMLQHNPAKTLVMWLDRVFDLRGAPSRVQEQLTGWRQRWVQAGRGAGTHMKREEEQART